MPEECVWLSEWCNCSAHLTSKATTGLLLFSGADPLFRHALLDSEDISAEIDAQLLLHTDDQNLDAHFESLEPPLEDSDYLFSLDQGEGISDLFDIDDIQI